MIKVYRKTATIKAEQFDGSDEMVDKYELIDAGTMLGTHHSPELYLTGSGKINVGDWIATGVSGEHWTIADDVFKQTYAELPVIPENVAYIIKQAKKGDYKLGWVFNATYLGIWRVSVGNWIRTHAETFARAWLDGYVVEEEK
ncbi:DUF1642 domain-containing protein [Lactiplantibacillus plantarum]|uniref:DUF1642 domain-containing protein n=1 Tax=Lactiplantibacillus plantarum TaxID=1590 RepID=UPI001E434B94|nr:DUF1642 domain-containing protein [Lactiplantibacillus plantarum]MCC6116954.1 DUF1642 domain-containing protein [Lactiplantibacillus plantarum]MCG0679853.1 hypothetical protein [Lactiplantibacillus plantarum]MCW6114502.1 DUF1642 domain-containing protein [Lactiplantibacillus plantarum]